MIAARRRILALILLAPAFEIDSGESTAFYYDRNRKYVPDATEEIVTFSAQECEGSEKTIMRRGMLMIRENAPATIIIAHGFMANAYDALTFRPILFDGYNTLVFDFRAHGENAEGQICTFGKNEAFDVIGAVKFVKSHPRLKYKPIIMYGFSMGAMATLEAHRQDPDLFSPKAKIAPVVAGIYDCPGRSSDDIIQKGLDNIKFSLFGYEFGIPFKEFIKSISYHWLVQPILKTIFKFLARMDSTQINTQLQPFYPVESAKYVKTPSLFIICKNDEKVSPEQLIDVYRNVPASYKRCWIANGRRHFDPFWFNPEKYTYKVRRFIKKVLENDLSWRQPEKIIRDPKLLHHAFMGEEK